MQVSPQPKLGTTILCLVLWLLAGCKQQKTETAEPDHPRLTPKVALLDINFFSVALQRSMPYRIVLPSDYSTRNKPLPVIYVLHGGGGGFRDWTNYSDVARLAEQGIILVMPQGDSSYYMNAAERPQDRYAYRNGGTTGRSSEAGTVKYSMRTIRIGLLALSIPQQCRIYSCLVVPRKVCCLPTVDSLQSWNSDTSDTSSTSCGAAMTGINGMECCPASLKVS